MFPPEPDIFVGTRKLTSPQAMTVRVAHDGRVPNDITEVEGARDCHRVLSSFKNRLETEGLGDDETGKAICAGYIHHANGVMALLERTFGPLGDPHV